ncbi:MAG: LytTR family DNA-binding domain-containing protein [Bacteroidota bacterium]
MNKIGQLLNKPFPVEENTAGVFRTIVYVSLFITLFLYVFRPFDLHLIESNLLLTCLGFGSMTFLSCVIWEFVISRVLGFSRWRGNFTFGRWIVHMIGTILTISVANFIFARLTFFGYILWEYLPQMMISTFALGVFPVVVIGGLALIQQEKKYQHIAGEINVQNGTPPTHLQTEGPTIFSIPMSQVRYVEALQNYVKIGYLNSEHQLRERTERATLKSILAEAEGSQLVKCHRSFLVNRDAILSISGNAQGLLLTLYGTEKPIPVSRSYVSVFRKNQT